MAKQPAKKEKHRTVKPPKTKPPKNGIKPMDDSGSNPDNKPPKPPATP